MSKKPKKTKQQKDLQIRINKYIDFLLENGYVTNKNDETRKNCSMRISEKCIEEDKKYNGRKQKEFFKTINQNFYEANTMHICKDCIKKYSYDKKGEIDLPKFKKVLQMLDVPFFVSAYTSACNSDHDTIGIYFKIVRLNHFGKGWEDGEIERMEGAIENSYDATKERILKWGKLKLEEYEFLENELYRLKNDFECPDSGMEMIMKDICHTNLQVFKERNKVNVNHKTVSELIKTRDLLMSAGKLKPIQATGADRNDKVSFGTMVEKFEQTRPIEPKMTSEMKDYITIYIPGHIAKMEGLKNELTDKYQQMLDKYQIDDYFGDGEE